MAKKMGLGRGLSAILPDVEEVVESVEAAPGAAPLPEGTVVEIPVGDVDPNRNQPRKRFDEVELQALADSIAQHGLLQPLAVRDMGNGYYQIIAG